MTTPKKGAKGAAKGRKRTPPATPDGGTAVDAPVTREAVEAQYRELNLRCRGPVKSEETRVEVGRLLADGKREEAAQLDAQNRAGCGQDVGALILAGELDGEPKEVDCPRCGTTIRYTPPRVDG
jgi:DNA-directed RNA polymerase subunit RPC12/RpoP